jgi:hypothetical protein
MLPPAFFARAFPRAVVVFLGATATVDAQLPETIDFNRDVRPILSDKCFKCHGFDPGTRKADRRLDTREGALAEKDGVKAIAPGQLAQSDVSVRIHSTDKDEQMPPPKSGKTLTAQQIAIIDKWIEQGAPYSVHWAFVKPVQAQPPRTARLTAGIRNPIDAFVFARLERDGLAPSPEADPDTLCRRLYLDLTGLPPTPEEADACANDASPGAYERLVDRLLESPHYGERWARRWLDLARYADTNGYEKDRERSIWPYRDWVINALNAGMPFDEFTIEQIAGDLLPNATREQKIATGFHRNTMLNEEGGIDPLEYRYLAMVDRVGTTGAAWLGLTVQCAQCHTHKYDPIPQREYFQLMACMDNADEPDLDLPLADAAAREKERAEKLAKLLAELPGKFPVETNTQWRPLKPVRMETASGEQPKMLDDSSALFAAPGPEKDTYTFSVETDSESVNQLRVETFADAALPKNGPGRATNGNFVLSEITITAAPRNTPGEMRPVKIARAQADASQKGWEIEKAIDGKLETGWGVDLQDGKSNVSRAATFTFEKPVAFRGGARLTVKLEQQYGNKHTMGRVRFSVPVSAPDTRPVEVRQREIVETRFREWLAKERGRSVAWRPLQPAEAKSNSPLLTIGKDASVLASGDITKSDTYELKFANVPAGITAVRLEALPDERLPGHGPGLTYYEGPKGDFFLGEFQVAMNGEPLKIASATHSFAGNSMGEKNPVSAALAIDGDPQTGWSAHGREGEKSEAVFVLATPIRQGGDLRVKLTFGRHYACSLGRLRISATTAPRGAEAREIPDAIEALLRVPDSQLTAAQLGKLREQFLISAPELADARKEIDALRKPLKHTTTLVLRERPPENPRPTFLHHRGEWLQPKERVEPGVLSVLGTWPADAPHNRLGFARWLVSRENPLTARVVMNREWTAFFGRGIVRTLGDFGFQGEAPTHPELLDWLAVEFMKRGWSMKQMHRLIVTSATYRQSSAATPDRLARDSDNRLLSRGPRFRLDAEVVRDSALRASGLLSEKIGGPSVHPPQPDGVTEVAYGSPKWTASTGPDRYRRSLYTFAKRTAPFALYNTFDAPTGEACIARRDVSNTPLQALALLNDVVFLEAAQSLGNILAAHSGSVEERIRIAFRRVLTRPPTGEEARLFATFFETQKSRFTGGEIDPKTLAGQGPGDVADRAAWTALARALFNLDEAVTRS